MEIAVVLKLRLWHISK